MYSLEVLTLKNLVKRFYGKYWQIAANAFNVFFFYAWGDWGVGRGRVDGERRAFAGITSKDGIRMCKLDTVR